MERTASSALDAIERRLSQIICTPEGVEAAVAAEPGDGAVTLDHLLRGDRGIPAAERLSVYAHAWFARLHDALLGDFGALAEALGPDAFHDLVKTYLSMHPPTRASLRHAGSDLALHLSTEPFASIFARRCPFAADLARLEWAIAEAFFAADSPILRPGDLARLSTADWSALRFETIPALALLRVDWPVERVRACFEVGGAPTGSPAPPLERAPTILCVWRRRERVRYRAIESAEALALDAAIAGEDFSTICDRAAGDGDGKGEGDDERGESEAAPRAARMLARWLDDEILASATPAARRRADGG